MHAARCARTRGAALTHKRTLRQSYAHTTRRGHTLLKIVSNLLKHGNGEEPWGKRKERGCVRTGGGEGSSGRWRWPPPQGALRVPTGWWQRSPSVRILPSLPYSTSSNRIFADCGTTYCASLSYDSYHCRG